MISRRKIASDTFELTFKPSLIDKTTIVKYSKRLKGYTWIGKHFSITSKKHNKTRFYSVCLCLNEYLYDLHVKLIENLKKKNTKENPGLYDFHNVAFDIKNPKAIQDTLELYIKQYSFNTALSYYLTNYKVNPEFDSNLHYEGDLIINGPLVNIANI